jgi:hypothetical protein
MAGVLRRPFFGSVTGSDLRAGASVLGGAGGSFFAAGASTCAGSGALAG